MRAAQDLERLRHLWRLGPPSAALFESLIGALLRARRPEEARGVALDAVGRGALSGEAVAESLRSLGALDRWSGELGQGPLCASLSAPPRGPSLEVRWRWRSHDPNDTYGKPLCAGFGVVAALLQNAVVGMRFERLVCLDADTGCLRWSQERRALLASAPPAWAGGTEHPVALLWAYVTPAGDADEDEEDDDEDAGGALLRVERLDLATGQTLSVGEWPLETGAGLEVGPSLVGWGEGRLGWLLRWRSSGECAVACIDEDSGALVGLEPLPVFAFAVAQVGGGRFAVDETGLVQVEGARVETLGALEPPIGASSGVTLFGSGGALYVSSVGHRGLMGPVHGCRWRLAERKAVTFHHPRVPSGDLYLVASSPLGEVLLTRASGGEPLTAQTTRGDVTALYVAEAGAGWRLKAVDASLWRALTRRRGLWMGGAWLVAAAGGHMTTLTCLDADTLTTRWRWDARGRWQQGPIPAGSGALAAVDGEGVILLGDMSDSGG